MHHSPTSLPSLLLKSLSCNIPHHPPTPPHLSFFFLDSSAVSGHSPILLWPDPSSHYMYPLPTHTHTHTPPWAASLPTSFLLSAVHLDQFSLPYLLRWLSQWQLLLFRRRRLQLEASRRSRSLLEKAPVASQDFQTELPVIRWRTCISHDVRRWWNTGLFACPF